ncbi:MAG: glycosyltransferase family 39 protein [Actinobacteria bacterium]|nr:glycosyltransferase family 39 protein [Actinomycetota bacterium]MCL5882861.1 glycosyltransferase family 39 protein [Actinomycetota bacterium]
MLLFTRVLFRHKHIIQSADVPAGARSVPGLAGKELAVKHCAAYESAAACEPAAPLPLIERARARTPRIALVLSLGAIVLFVLLITLPFINQPLHMDDGTFLDFAKVNLVHPFQQHIPDYHLMGVDIPAFRDTHPAVDWLYITLLMKLTGSDSEPLLHLGYIIFPLIAAVSMFFLSRRFIKNALLATLLILATPALMTASHTLMGDMPLLALWLAATAIYIYGVDRGDMRLLVLAGVATTLAVFAGYQGLALLVLLPAYAWINRRLSWRTVLPLLLPAAAFGLFTVYNYIDYGGPPRFTHAKGLSMQEGDLIGRFQGTLLQVGGASVFPLALAGIFALRRRRYFLLPIVGAIAAAWGIYHYRNDAYTAAAAVLFVIFMTGVVMALASVTADGIGQLRRIVLRREFDADFVFLALWLLSMLAAVIVLLPHSTAKYSLPFLAPLILMVFREAEARIPSRKVLMTVMSLAVFFTLGTGVIVSAADYQLAQTYKDYALSFDPAAYRPGGAKYQGPPFNGVSHIKHFPTVWFVGEWGFRHYMESEGYQYLTTDSTAPVAGDLIVKPRLSEWPLADQVTSRMRLVGTTVVQGSLPVRVMSFEAGAGLYGNFWGPLPYSVSDAPIERFDVYQVAGNQP